jgi:glycine/D-amino acid oxidase-like deaminating enzyme
LNAEQLQAIGWDGFEGLKGAGNRFHYARRTADNRILWGGYDAVYHWGNGVGPEFERDQAMFAKLSTHFLTMFPQLSGIRFTHAWGGAIDTCSRFIPFWVQRGPVASVAGFTGLGVGSSRFAAGVMLDLLDARRTPSSQLEIVRTKPLPFPPEPLRTGVVALTRWSLARADARGGRRNAWLWLLDRLGLGFDS